MKIDPKNLGEYKVYIDVYENQWELYGFPYSLFHVFHNQFSMQIPIPNPIIRALKTSDKILLQEKCFHEGE